MEAISPKVASITCCGDAQVIPKPIDRRAEWIIAGTDKPELREQRHKGNAMNQLGKISAGIVAGYAGLMAVRLVARQRRRFDWKGKRVLITGGSRGLGLVLARQLADAGARLAICARSETELRAAADDLARRGTEVLAVTCDVGDPSAVDAFVRRAAERLGGVDVLFNVAGTIIVGPFDAMTENDFSRSMRTNCWGALNTTLAVLPHMRDQGWGRVVNVASIGGKLPLPHLLPYVASKFAMVGLSNGLRSELKRENILVTTACPGLMRTGSPRNATFKGQHRKECTWFTVADSLPVLSINAERAAKQLITACQEGRGEVFIHHPLDLTFAAQRWFPELTRELIGLADRVLPSMGGIGRDAAKGYQSQTRWTESALTAWTQKAAQENHQIM